MYFCTECKQFFDSPMMQYEVEWDGAEFYPITASPICPNCGSGYITETSVCKRCGEPHTTDKDFCPECLATIKCHFEKWLSDEAFDIPGNMIDGKELVKDAVVDFL